MKTKKPIIEKDLTKFHFDESFKRTFDTVIDVYAKTLNELNKVSSGKTLKSEFGVCNCTYKMRYITPENISEYVSNLIKGIESGLFEHNSTDIEMFSVASVKRFIEDNGCDVFESSSVLSSSRNYVNPKEYTLQDLLLISENDIGNTAVYSSGEIAKRLEIAGTDVKKLNSMHFTAAIKNIVNSMSSVIEKSNCYICNTPAALEIFKIHLQEFIIFTATLNTITLLQLIGYLHPAVEYTTVEQGGGTQGVITECCLCNTNDMMIRNFIPFNCNMRDIVLQDITPNFRDVHDALHFIMKNYRSPISILVNKFATKEANVGMDCSTISRMFSGHRDYHHDDDLFKKDGERMLGGQRPLDIAGFETSVTWLDNIAFGNNYIDGNYRRDGNGNATVHPIMNTLDMLYKIFNGVELKTNEDLANNVVRVACLMRGIIHDYNDERPIPNYDLVKDILVVLGEIFTRNMLKLYYNNTRVFVYSDDMPDTMDPGFICMESFVMEADTTTQNAGTPKTPTGQPSTAAPKVSFNNESNQQLRTNLKTKSSIIMQRFVEWVRTNMMKFSDTFNQNHGKEVEWIKKNADLNEKIKKDIGKGFKPKVTNMPQYKINMDFCTKIKMTETVDKYIEPKDDDGFNTENFVFEAIKDENVAKVLRGIKEDPEKQSATWGNYILFGQPTAPENYTGDLTAAMWETMCKDLTETMPLIKGVCKTNSEDINKAAIKIKQKMAELESIATANGEVNKNIIEKKKRRLEDLEKGVQTITKNYEITTLNVLNTKFYRTTYNLYRDIVAGYKQQTSENNTANTNDSDNENIGKDMNSALNDNNKGGN